MKVLLSLLYLTYFKFVLGTFLTPRQQEHRYFQVYKRDDAKGDYYHRFLPEVEIVGSKFFDVDSGEQFFMKGIAYQPSKNKQDTLKMEENNDNGLEIQETKYIDPLGDPNICLRDLPYLVKLGVNTVRIYSVNPKLNHDQCMDAFARYGIYVLFDLSEPDVSISRDSPSWDVTIFQRYKDVVDCVSRYSNTLGVFAGNEVTTDRSNTYASSFVKASVRDIKKYINESETIKRKIPVGYSTNDDPDVREELSKYFVCDSDDEKNVDFYGINMYEWCGYSSFVGSGYKDRTVEFQKYPVPVFFSEFGCNDVRPRPFTEVEALFSPLMTKVWSGGLVYMYFEEENMYGVVEIGEKGQVVKLDDFEYLEKEYTRAKPKGYKKQEYLDFLSKSEKLTNSKVSCPSKSLTWDALSGNEEIPPTPDFAKCSCLDTDLPCIVTKNLDTKSDYRKLFKYFCGKVDCSEIAFHEDQHGKYSDCSLNQKLSYILSKFYIKTDDKSNTCPPIQSVDSNSLSSKNYGTVYFNKNYKTNTKCDFVLSDTKNDKNKNNLKSSEKDGIDEKNGKDKNSKKSKTDGEMKPKSKSANKNAGSNLETHILSIYIGFIFTVGVYIYFSSSF